MRNTLHEYPFRLIHSTGWKKHDTLPPTHYCIRNAQLMAATHNTIFRAFNAIYAQASLVQPGAHDAEDLLHYCRMVFRFLHDHHTVEETVYFPAIERASGIAGLMAENVEQHAVLALELDKFAKYADETLPEEYDAGQLRSIIEGLVVPLETHLHDEIPSIIDLHDKIVSRQLKAIYRAMHDEAVRINDPFQAAPLVMGCQDRSFRIDGDFAAFPEVPFIAPYIVDAFIRPRYANVWRFNPSNQYGKPRGLDSVPARVVVTMHWAGVVSVAGVVIGVLGYLILSLLR